jgi:hypothetical protein
MTGVLDQMFELFGYKKHSSCSGIQREVVPPSEISATSSAGVVAHCFVQDNNKLAVFWGEVANAGLNKQPPVPGCSHPISEE